MRIKMKKFIAPMLITTIVAGCSSTPPVSEITRTTASDGRYRPGYRGQYDGPPPSFKRDQWERRPSGFSYCDKYRNDTAKHVLACGAGVDAAKTMAQKFAGQQGREDGYLRGYSWGLSQSINYYQNSPEEIQRGENAVDSLDRYIGPATDEGVNAGTRDGESLGSSEAKGRYYRAVDTKVMPTPNVQTPTTNFNPTANAYTRYVGAIPTPEDIMRRDRYGRISFYDSYDRSYAGRDWRERSGRDMWSRNGDYNSNSSNWVDGNFAFGQWEYMQNAPGKNKYNSLNDAASGGGKGPGGANPSNPTQPTQPAAPVVDYQNIFRDAFVQTYNVFAPNEYSQKYHSTIDDGQRDGESVGYEVGSEIAQTKGLASAFNRRFAQYSYSAYLKTFANSYSSSFNSTFNYYKTTPVLSLDFMGLIGADNDGVMQPGESFAVKFKVTNAGGVASQLKYTIAGDVENEKTFTDSINAISTKTIVSQNIGEILSTLEDQSTGSYILNVNGLQERQWQDIKRPLIMSGFEYNLSALDGSGIFTITIANVSTTSVNGKIALELKINGTSVKTVNGNTMKAGEKISYALDFNGLDPFVWIMKGYPVEVVLKYNDTAFSRKTTSLVASDTDTHLAMYYTRLINEKGTYPKNVNVDNRIAEVKSAILSRNVAEVKSHYDSDGNVYKDTPERTIPGKVLREKEAYTNSSRANGDFTGLADAMAPEAKKFKSFLFIHPKKNAYNEILGKIGGKKYK